MHNYMHTTHDYVRMYVCMNKCSVYMYVSMYTHRCLSQSINRSVFLCLYVNVRVHVCFCAWIYVCTCACACVCVRVCVCVCVCVCWRMQTPTLSIMHFNTYTCTPIHFLTQKHMHILVHSYAHSSTLLPTHTHARTDRQWDRKYGKPQVFKNCSHHSFYGLLSADFWCVVVVCIYIYVYV